MDNLISDIRYAVRNLIKRPGFTLIAVITLALGIGANSAIFSAVNALLLKPLQFPEIDRVVTVWDKIPARGVEHNECTFANYLDWKTQNQTFEHLGLSRWWSANLSGSDSPERVQGFLVTSSFFNVLGTKPLIGRTLLEEENQPGKDAVAVIGYSLWQRRFGGDPNIINKQINVNNIKRTVVGVMPERFNYPKGSEIYAPIAITPELARSRDSHSFYVIGRLKPGVTEESAQADLDTIAARLEKQYPESNTGWSPNVIPIVADTVRQYNTALWVMMGAVGFVLLIACANVANLMLARTTGRQKELALRAALGASRWRIVRQLLTESLIVALVGGALGVLVAIWGIDLLRASNPGEASRFAAGWDQLGINRLVLLFTFGLSVLSGLLFGLAPALQVSRPNLNNALKEGGRQGTGGSNRLRSSFVVAEIALSLILLIGAGLLVRSFMSLLKINPGFNPENVMTMMLVLPGAKYREDPQRAAFFKELVQKAQTVPGVQSAAVVNYIPLGGANSSDSYLVEGQPEPQPGQENIGRYRVCSPEYFKTMGISVLKGRGFTSDDKPGATPVVIINEALAKAHWPNGDAVGKRIRLYGPIESAPWMQVVGIAQDVKFDLNIPVTPDFFLPHEQDPWNAMVLVARTSIDPSTTASALRQQVWDIDKDQPVFDVKTMEEVRAISINLYSISSAMLGIFAGVALLLASIGIYGVMAFAVTQRTQEIGIRMALGASNSDVLRLVIKHGMLLAVAGVGIGLAGAFGLTRFLGGLLVGVSSTDLLTFGVVTFCLLFAAFLACYLPARRATKVDPLVALRYE
jgi:putative ABC transport system permease protein